MTAAMLRRARADRYCCTGFRPHNLTWGYGGAEVHSVYAPWAKWGYGNITRNSYVYGYRRDAGQDAGGRGLVRL